MAVGGVLGNGTRVAFSATSPVTWVRIAQLLDIPTFLSFISNDIDTTVHSPSRVMTSMPGLIPVPEVILDLLADLDPATTVSHETLRTYQVSGLTIYFRIEIPVDRTQTNFRAFELQGYVKEWTPTATQIAAAQKLKVTIKFAGGYAVYAPAPPSIV